MRRALITLAAIASFGALLLAVAAYAYDTRLHPVGIALLMIAGVGVLLTLPDVAHTKDSQDQKRTTP